MNIRSVVLDVGETLIDETRLFGRWADRLGVPHLTFFGALGAMAAAGRPLIDAFRLVRPGFDLEAEIAAWREEEPGSLRENFDSEDLYPDVRPALTALREAGLQVLIAGNQPVQAGPALEAMGLPVDAIHISDVWGVAKPDPAFFARVAQEAGNAPEEILYVGDRVDNDVLPAKEAGMCAALLRRGPWGYLHSELPEAARADVIVDSLAELPGWVAARR
ncbi:HAD family hydrolase [Marinactinospora thermotolerans]|uniref:Haloacid dehalogenase superfamily, subfamily IA, variant 3 with third motif having DD or ED/haloacid dehalogenase superfamily, subfamily IA, variant 1 with third motif having Dx(3-4)D or Dx(3-4)E n=1 Tax=Marinactinospora thermotolerans DSM 45154 TaxID=1122192 RepID=A0A1T4SDR5_9ACTN|nr:HAD family hydrolase [Marinactinospora thermotolerans]SKA26414.1 haloacid dehalogenase superfamily, subfamily IA, variant 3 with third motif having DD or ED/haloacid dehalogenase superfamily, subfamily IA, variant 1 with third motif having Dx(3-4)D or Dx(3-4)E [Marinactinospora thermotolerans DSM 45154]